VAVSLAEAGHETLRLTEAGIQVLARARQRNQRARSPHDRLAHRLATQLIASGRLAWLELSLRAQVPAPAAVAADGVAVTDRPVETAAHPGVADGTSLFPSECEASECEEALTAREPAPAATWRMARPDVFSVRHTSVERYLHPMVHEVKVSRADLLSDLRHAAKRTSYQWLCCECYYVFPAGTATLEEIPEDLGVWVVHGDVDTGRLELLRPARHSACTLPFAVWMALAQSTPLRLDPREAQAQLGGQSAGEDLGLDLDTDLQHEPGVEQAVPAGRARERAC
jgi:hypothetical protein